ncbi:HAMP domain-containing sensor histidine kinase [Balneolaceae bacterium ANBcel3]|nr:HAMP domain-containing sensor histidine kinase [Balneolaceae bacterium ANBcel3]
MKKRKRNIPYGKESDVSTAPGKSFYRISEDGPSPVYQLLKQMEELAGRHKKMEQEAKARKRVLSLTAHDLMSPINAISGYLDLMKFSLDTEADVDQIRRYRDKIKNGINDITNIVQQLREMSKHEDLHDFMPLDVDLNWVVRDACDVMEGAALAKEHELECLLTPQPVYVSADLPRLKRILFNLISNSIKYTPRGGGITVRVTSDDANAMVSVQDNGLGIPKDSFQDIFKAETKLHYSGTENESSSGLGLYISAHFAKQMKGRITLESELRKGSSFTLHLPLSDSSSSQNGHSKPDESSSSVS